MDIDNPDVGNTKSNNQMQMLQSGQGGHEVQGVNSNAGIQSVSNVSSPRSMMAIGRGRGTLMHGGGTLSHIQNTVPHGGMHIPGQHPYSGMSGTQHSGKPMGNMPNVGGNMALGQMQGMGRSGSLMGQRGKFGKKGKTRNIPIQGGQVGKGKGIPGVPGGGNNQSGILSSQGGKPSMGMYSQGNNSLPQNASGGNPMSGNMGGPGQQWGSNNMMSGMPSNVSGNSQFGSSTSAGSSVGSSNYGTTGMSGAPSQPPPHYNAAVAQQQMIQNASGGSSSHMAQGARFPNMNSGGSHATGAPIGPGHSGKQALQNMLRARGPQFMNTAGNAPSVSGSTPGNQAQFVSPRQSFQNAPAQASNNTMQGTASGTSNRFGGIGGAPSNVGATSGMSRMQNQFNNQNLGVGQNTSNQFNSGNYGSSPQVSSSNSSSSMPNMNSYMMRGAQPGSFSTNNQVMMNRQNVMGGNMPGAPGPGGNFMPRMGQNNYMQSPNVNMGNVMQGGSYRNIGSGMQPQPNAVNSQSNMERMRMQNPHLLAQLQRSPANAPPNSQNQQHGNPFQQNRF